MYTLALAFVPAFPISGEEWDVHEKVGRGRSENHVPGTFRDTCRESCQPGSERASGLGGRGLAALWVA